MGLHEAPMLSKTPMNENDIFCTNALFIRPVRIDIRIYMYMYMTLCSYRFNYSRVPNLALRSRYGDARSSLIGFHLVIGKLPDDQMQIRDHFAVGN